MSEGYIQLQADSTGKKVRTITSGSGDNQVHQEVFMIIDTGSQLITPAKDSSILSAITSPPTGKSVVEMDLGYSGSYVKNIYYSGSALLFTLTFNYSGSYLTGIVRT